MARIYKNVTSSIDFQQFFRNSILQKIQFSIAIPRRGDQNIIKNESALLNSRRNFSSSSTWNLIAPVKFRNFHIGILFKNT